jgi:hypothetical protein
VTDMRNAAIHLTAALVPILGADNVVGSLLAGGTGPNPSTPVPFAKSGPPLPAGGGGQ